MCADFQDYSLAEFTFFSASYILIRNNLKLTELINRGPQVLLYYEKSTSHEMLEAAIPWSREVQQRIGKQAQAELNSATYERPSPKKTRP